MNKARYLALRKAAKKAVSSLAVKTLGRGLGRRFGERNPADFPRATERDAVEELEGGVHLDAALDQ
jgi:hypothetical protein